MAKEINLLFRLTSYNIVPKHARKCYNSSLLAEKCKVKFVSSKPVWMIGNLFFFSFRISYGIPKVNLCRIKFIYVKYL